MKRVIIQRYRHITAARQRLIKKYTSVFSRKNARAITIITVITLAIVTGWILTLSSGRINMGDPVIVSQQFVIDLQANHPNKAYALTSSAYQRRFSNSDFNGGVAKSLIEQLPSSKPELFQKAFPPANDVQHKGQVEVVLNIAKDSQFEDNTMQLILLQERSEWRIQSFTLILGKSAHQADSKTTPAQ